MYDCPEDNLEKDQIFCIVTHHVCHPTYYVFRSQNKLLIVSIIFFAYNFMPNEDKAVIIVKVIFQAFMYICMLYPLVMVWVKGSL